MTNQFVDWFHIHQPLIRAPIILHCTMNQSHPIDASKYKNPRYAGRRLWGDIWTEVIEDTNHNIVNVVLSCTYMEREREQRSFLMVLKLSGWGFLSFLWVGLRPGKVPGAETCSQAPAMPSPPNTHTPPALVYPVSWSSSTLLDFLGREESASGGTSMSGGHRGDTGPRCMPQCVPQ